MIWWYDGEHVHGECHRFRRYTLKHTELVISRVILHSYHWFFAALQKNLLTKILIHENFRTDSEEYAIYASKTFYLKSKMEMKPPMVFLCIDLHIESAFFLFFLFSVIFSQKVIASQRKMRSNRIDRRPFDHPIACLNEPSCHHSIRNWCAGERTLNGESMLLNKSQCKRTPETLCCWILTFTAVVVVVVLHFAAPQFNYVFISELYDGDSHGTLVHMVQIVSSYVGNNDRNNHLNDE